MKLNTGRAKKKLVRDGKLPQGTGVGLFGTTYNPKTKKREIDQVEADIVREIFERIASGQATISVARDLNSRRIRTKGTKADSASDQMKHWHSLTIRRMIRNTAFMGRTYFGMTTRVDKGHLIQHPKESWTLLPGVTPALVTEELFNNANAQLNKPNIRTGRPKHQYLLRNHAFCAICGKPLVGHVINKKYRYYQCSNARPYENHGKKCHALYIRADDLEEMVWSKTQEVLSNPDIVLGELTKTTDQINPDSLDAEIKEMEKVLCIYERRRSNLLEAMELGEFKKNEVLDRMNALKQLRCDSEGRLNNLRKTRDHLTSMSNAHVKVDELYQRVIDNLADATLEIKAMALDALDIQVHAKGNYDVQIKGVIPLELTSPTTGRT